MNIKPIKVLLVEDNPRCIRLMQERLDGIRLTGPTAHTFGLECADRLSTGLDRLATGDIDLILLDLSLPDSHGLDTLAEVRAQAPQVPVVVLTDLDDEAVAVEALREGAQDYLVKGETDHNLLVRVMLYAMERKRERETLEHRVAQLALINDVGRKIAAALNLDEVLDRATSLIQESFDYWHVGLFLLDEATGELEIQAMADSFASVAPPGCRLALGEGTVGWVAKTGQPLLTNDVSQEPRHALGIPKEALTQAELCVPLKLAGRVIGVLDIQSTQLNAFNETDLMAMETLADQLAVAIENARLHEAAQRRLEELVFLNQISHTVNSSLDLEQILTTVMEETATVLGTEAGSIVLLDEESGELVFEAAVGSRSREVKGRRVPVGQGIAGWVAREGQSLLVSDVREDPRFYPGIDGATGFVTRSVLAVPLKVRGTVIGVIEAVNKTEGDFNQTDITLLSSMAQSAAIAIENAQLFAETQRRFEEMAALYSVSLDIISRLEMSELLKSIVERAVGLLRSQAGGVYLYDQERQELRLAIGYDYTEKYVGVTLKPGEGMAGKVFQTGEPLIVDDYRTWEGRAPVYEADQPFSAMLGVPLKWQERVIGVLAINADAQGRTFNQEDVWLASLFASQVAIAIENAGLYEELQNRMEELKRAQAHLIQSEKLVALGRLSASLAHEINNPLQAVIGCLGLAQEALAEGEGVDPYLRVAHEEVRRVARTVAQMRDLYRPEPGEKKPTEVNVLLEQVLELSRKQCQEHRVEIAWKPATNLPPVLVVADRIKQVFLNLLLNAIEAMPEGGRLQVGTAYTSQPAGVSIEFSDSGEGIAPDILPHIFEPFYSTKPEGTGLGLSISHGIVQQYGGYIEVESRVGEGSTFAVWLPVRT